MELNKTFIDGLWSKEINVSDFVSNNITSYTGDASFLQGPTERTKHIWNLCLKALEEKRANNLSLIHISGNGTGCGTQLQRGDRDCREIDRAHGVRPAEVYHSHRCGLDYPSRRHGRLRSQREPDGGTSRKHRCV